MMDKEELRTAETAARATCFYECTTTHASPSATRKREGKYTRSTAMSLALLEGYSPDSRICKRFPPTLNLTSSLICDNIHFSGGLPYVPPGWLLAVGALAFFAILLVRDDHEREKRKLQDRIEQLEAELVEKQKAQQTHIWPEDLWIDPKELPAGE